MSVKLNFITNDELIRSNLLQSMDESSNDRNSLSTFITDDFCRNLHNLIETLREHNHICQWRIQSAGFNNFQNNSEAR